MGFGKLGAKGGFGYLGFLPKKTASGGGPSVSITQTDHAEDATSQTTYTWSSRAFAVGAADANRRVVVAIASRVVFASPVGPNSVTIGGIAATQIALGGQAPASNSDTISLWQASIPTGTTATVSAVFGTAMLRAGCIAFSVITTQSAVPSGANITQDNINNNSTGTLTVPAGGGAIIAGMTIATTPTATPSNYTADLAATNIASTTYYTAGHDLTSGSRTYTITWSGSPGDSAGVFAAWGP